MRFDIILAVSALAGSAVAYPSTYYGRAVEPPMKKSKTQKAGDIASVVSAMTSSIDAIHNTYEKYVVVSSRIRRC